MGIIKRKDDRRSASMCVYLSAALNELEGTSTPKKNCNQSHAFCSFRHLRTNEGRRLYGNVKWVRQRVYRFGAHSVLHRALR